MSDHAPSFRMGLPPPPLPIHPSYVHSSRCRVRTPVPPTISEFFWLSDTNGIPALSAGLVCSAASCSFAHTLACFFRTTVSVVLLASTYTLHVALVTLTHADAQTCFLAPTRHPSLQLSRPDWRLRRGGHLSPALQALSLQP
eukprot:3427206-Pleurochrysis_carterae.AAC.1